MSFDTRTIEQKTQDEIDIKIKRHLSDLMTSGVAVEYYTQIVGDVRYKTKLDDGEYLFIDPAMNFIHIYRFTPEGDKIRDRSINVRYTETIKYKIG